MGLSVSLAVHLCYGWNVSQIYTLKANPQCNRRWDPWEVLITHEMSEISVLITSNISYCPYNLMSEISALIRVRRELLVLPLREDTAKTHRL